MEKSAGSLSFPELLQRAATQGGGALQVHDSERIRSGRVYFADSKIYAVHVDGFLPEVAKRLLTAGLLAQVEYDSLISTVEDGPASPTVGAKCVQQGFIDQPILDAIHRELLLSAVGAMSSWHGPVTRFRKNVATDQFMVPPVSVKGVLAAVSRRTAHWKDIWLTLAPDISVTVAVPHIVLEHAEQPLVSPDAQALFRAIDGHRSVDEVAGECGLTRFETSHLLHLLAADNRVVIRLAVSRYVDPDARSLSELGADKTHPDVLDLADAVPVTVTLKETQSQDRQDSSDRNFNVTSSDLDDAEVQWHDLEADTEKPVDAAEVEEWLFDDAQEHESSVQPEEQATDAMDENTDNEKINTADINTADIDNEDIAAEDPVPTPTAPLPVTPTLIPLAPPLRTTGPARARAEAAHRLVVDAQEAMRSAQEEATRLAKASALAVEHARQGAERAEADHALAEVEAEAELAQARLESARADQAVTIEAVQQAQQALTTITDAVREAEDAAQEAEENLLEATDVEAARKEPKSFETDLGDAEAAEAESAAALQQAQGVYDSARDAVAHAMARLESHRTQTTTSNRIVHDANERVRLSRIRCEQAREQASAAATQLVDTQARARLAADTAQEAAHAADKAHERLFALSAPVPVA